MALVLYIEVTPLKLYPDYLENATLNIFLRYPQFLSIFLIRGIAECEC